MNVPVRFTPEWWLVIGTTTLVVGVVAFAVLVSATGFAAWQLLLAWAVITLTGDAIMAIGMEAVAPARVLAGPGDRRFDSDEVRDLAVVVSGFHGTRLGSVRVRGEIWNARLPAGETGVPEVGAKMRIIDRDGLTLVVSHDAGQRADTPGGDWQAIQGTGRRALIGAQPGRAATDEHVADFIAAVARWARGSRDILGLALVGSQARGTASDGSDVDLLLLSRRPADLLRVEDWTKQFGDVVGSRRERYGALTSIRVFYSSGVEAEFGIAEGSWARLPLDPGTRRVIADGMRVLHDPESLLRVASMRSMHDRGAG